MMRCLAFVLAAPFAAPAAAGSVSLGNVVLHYDETKWEPGPEADGRGLRTFVFVCIADGCRKRPFVWASAAPVGTVPEGCSERTLLEEGRTARQTALAAGPLALSLVTTFSGCRAYVPAHRSACAVDAGFVYRFGTGGHFGCRGFEGAPEVAFREFLSGISAP